MAIPTDPKNTSGRTVHEILAHSYFIYLAAVVVGFGADLVWKLRFSFPREAEVGLLAIMAGTVMVVWAQRSSRRGSAMRNKANETICRDHFCVGPYVFTRTPTQYGLTLLVLGLAALYGSPVMFAAGILAFLIGRFFFIPKEEHHLTQKYGAAYLDYKKHVKF